MGKISRSFINLLGWMFSIAFTLLIIGGAIGLLLFNHYSNDLPDYTQLSNYDPPTVTRLYAADGRLMAEYATEKRVFVPLKAMPKRLIQAFLSAEDKNFYEHTGIDLTGIARAVRDNVINYGQGKSLVGGSTITQQVVKNFLLSSEKSIERKVKEAILAMRISQVYSKDKILELYLNEIYLGQGSYGVAAAAQNYFNKSLDELTVEEMALLAALPKAPSQYNPKTNHDVAKARRDWVIERMLEGGYMTTEEFDEAVATDIVLRSRDATSVARADFFAEEVRRWLAQKYGERILYEGGLVVKTTLDPEMQKESDKALRKALVEYDRRRGYRGPMGNIGIQGGWKERLTKVTKDHAFHILDDQKLALVVELEDKRAQIAFADDTRGTLPFSLMKWTRLVVADGKLGPEVKRPADILKVGDVVLVGSLSDEQKKLVEAAEQKKAWDLKQVPEVNGAMVVLDPHTGRVLAMSGGYAYGGSEFNRVTQAKRQPGSAFKPFVYLAGLENGFSPSTVILDAPVEMQQGAGMPAWKPQNYHDEYLGPTTVRVGLEKSRNTMTVRMAQAIGLDKVLSVSKRFGIYDDPPPNFSIVLGSAETTMLRLANAYGMLVNGGHKIMPSIIERIDDRHGKTIYRRDERACPKCAVQSIKEINKNTVPPIPDDTREQMVDPRVAYQMISMLEGAALRGTGARAHADLRKSVAGKTGTTNDSMDTWFMGFTPDLVAGVYVGYDKPRTLGKKETGSSVALPAFISFMKYALADKQDTPFRIPPGIQLVRVNLASGLPADGTEAPGERIIDEAFISGDPIYVPGFAERVQDPAVVDALDNSIISDGSSEAAQAPVLPTPASISPLSGLPEIPREQPPPPTVGTGGLY